MKTIKIIALICAIVFLAVGVDSVGYAIAWLPFCWATYWVLSDRELMKKWNELMDDLGA